MCKFSKDCFIRLIFLKSLSYLAFHLELGILFSLLICSVIIVLFLKSSFYNKENSSVISQLTVLENWPKIPLNRKNFEFASAIFDRNLKHYEIDPSIFNISIYIKKYAFFNASKKEMIRGYKSFHECTTEDFHFNAKFFENSGFVYFYCLDDLNFDIEGL